VALAALLLASCPRPPAGPDAALAGLADLVTIEGSVRLTRAGQTAPATPGPLFQGDTLETLEKSRAVLRFKDWREVEIGENGRFVIAEGAGEISLDLSGGVVVSRLGATGTGRGILLSILTPIGISRIPAGGEATVSVGGGTTTIEVRTGEITFVGKDGKEQVAKGGEKLEVTLGSVKIVRPGALAPDAGAVTLDAIEVKLSVDRGSLLVKSAEEAKFRPVVKGVEQTVVEGTAFRLAPGSRGALSAGGLRVRLAAGAEGTVGRAARDSSGERYQLDLAKGASQMLLTGPGKRTIGLAAPTGNVEIKASEEASLTFTRDARSARAEVQVGTVEFSYDGQKRTVQAGEVADLGKSLTVAPRPRAALTLPAGRRIRIWESGAPLREVALTWPQVEDARRLEVATDPGFKDIVVQGKPVGNSVIVPATPNGELYWRVLGASDEPLCKGQARFTPEKLVPMVAGHPVNEVAETGLKATVYYQSVLPALVFNFPPIDGAARYRVRVYRADDLNAALVDKTVTERRCAAEPGKLAEGSYLWNATPLSEGGAELAGSRMNKLDVVYDNAMVSLTIQEPRPDQPVGDPVLTRGVAPLGSKLFINGKAAPLDAQGRFSVSLPRTGLLVYRLVTADMAESYWLRSLRAR
jgi:hypothetical protein